MSHRKQADRDNYPSPEPLGRRIAKNAIAKKPFIEPDLPSSSTQVPMGRGLQYFRPQPSSTTHPVVKEYKELVSLNAFQEAEGIRM